MLFRSGPVAEHTIDQRRDQPARTADQAGTALEKITDDAVAEAARAVDCPQGFDREDLRRVVAAADRRWLWRCR